MHEEGGVVEGLAQVGQQPHVAVAGAHALERNGVLADEVVADELVVEDDEAHQRHLWVVDVELETLLEDGAVALVQYRPRFLLCHPQRNRKYLPIIFLYPFAFVFRYFFL